MPTQLIKLSLIDTSNVTNGAGNDEAVIDSGMSIRGL